jgi:2-dehydro-3-deoxygalactonokinase
MERNDSAPATLTAMADTASRARAVGIDWGTTHRRGYLLDANGQCLASHADDDGLLAARGRFPASLQSMLGALNVASTRLPVLMSGMVGSAQGWVEVPYTPVGEPLADLVRHLHGFEVDGRRLAIVPGCMLRRGERVDVMRGEETQLLGALMLGYGDGWYVLPGTHSKWVHMRDGSVADFATYMTGELFAMLSQHGTLSAAMASNHSNGPGPEDDDAPEQVQAFEQGLRAAEDGALSNTLFGCRARVVTGTQPAGTARSYLSGLLIGAEWRDIATRHGGRLPSPVHVIGAAALARHHTRAAAFFGVKLQPLDSGEITIAGLARLLGLGAEPRAPECDPFR